MSDERSWWGRLLDKSVIASFDRTGFTRHAARFDELQPRPLPGITLITGGTSGIGLAAATALDELGARTVLWGRDRERGEGAAASLDRSSFTSVDLGCLDTVATEASALEGSLDAVVLCAGAMPRQRVTTDDGHELVWASQVLGHLTLLRTLRALGRLGTDTRVVWVSSGGMYLQPLELDNLDRRNGYQRHTVYANAKRAQVVLNRELATRWPEVWTAAMHPGWVDTDAVKHSMPVFRALTSPVLRDADEGADTIVWLVADAGQRPSGGFWFDRETAPVHFNARTKRSEILTLPLLDRVFADTEASVPQP